MTPPPTSTRSRSLGNKKRRKKPKLSRLAKPFEQIENQHSKTQQGTGLGLALTKSLVERHGGALEIESQPGVGTTVSFSLPVSGDSIGKSIAAA